MPELSRILSDHLERTSARSVRGSVLQRIDALLDDLSVSAKVLLAPISGLTVLSLLLLSSWSLIDERQAALAARHEAIRELHEATDDLPAHLAQIQKDLYKLSVWAAIGVTGEEIARTRANLEEELQSVLALAARIELGDSELEREFSRHFEAYDRQIRSAIVLSARNPVLGATAARGADEAYDPLITSARAMDDAWHTRAAGELRQLREQGQRLAQTFLLVVAGTAGLTLLWAVLLGRRISQPMLELVRAIDGLSSGHLDTPVPQLGRRDEIGRVASAITAFKESLVHTRALERQRRAFTDELERLAYRDTLTGLGNRTLFQKHLHDLAGGGSDGRRRALLLVDLDRFKEVNDTLGHDAGDLLLQQVALRLKASLRADEGLYRLGGDEFAPILDGLREGSAAAEVAGRIIGALRPRFDLAGHAVTVGASIGIALSAPGEHDPSDLIRHADLALYEVKARGRDGYQFFEERMNRTARRGQFLELELRSALERGQLELHYQPQVALASRELTGAEALLRWHHPAEGWITPGEFIPIAERSGLIVALGLWVLHQAAEQSRAWRAAGLRPLPLAVNVSPIQFRSAEFLEAALTCRERFGLPPGGLVLELTESIFLDADAAAIVASLNRLRDSGLALSLDDFGTGYSSLGYLRQLPFDELKIDGCFIQELLQTKEARKLTSGIIALGHSLGMRVIAEGVETESQARTLLGMGCDAGQGFHFERPLPARLFAGLLEAVPAVAGQAGVERVA